MWTSFVDRLTATPRQYGIYVVVYLLAGFAMNGVGKLLRIAEFAHWWQVVSCYGLYLLPASLLVRHLPVVQQYLYGLVVLAPLELIGYAIGSSHAFAGNVIDDVFGPRNFTLVMVIFFGWSLPAGNRLVAFLDRRPWLRHGRGGDSSPRRDRYDRHRQHDGHPAVPTGSHKGAR